MALSDGDLFVSGSILSYQQANRIYQNFRGATVPSALQAGALWSDSDDDRLWHQGTTLDEVFTEKTTLTWENLLSNPGFGVWSQSDASKGLATITYDQGAKGAGAAPSVGDAVVGGTSGATAKVISYTTATGTWDAGTATGVVTVGAVSHDFAFVDNETITFGGVETAVVNMPSSAVGVGLVQNGGFAVDEDPPNGWTAGTGATLTTEGAGKVGNCLMVTCDGTGWRYAQQMITTVVGKIYKATVYFKKGTAASGLIMVGTAPNDSTYFTSGTIIDAAWAAYTTTFEATTTTTYFTLFSGEANNTSYFDEVTAYEITPCCTAADIKAFDEWAKEASCDIYREHSGSNTKDGSFYALKIVGGSTSDYIYFKAGASDKEEWLRQFEGRTVTLGVWAKTSTASHSLISIQDLGGGQAYSSYHTGGGDWEWLEVTATIATTITELYFWFRSYVAPAVDGSTIIYLSQPMLVFGSHIGEGNYQPKPQEWIYGEKTIPSNKYDNKTSLSDAAYVVLNLEADSDAMIPKGAKAIMVHVEALDSGSGAATDLHIHLRKDSTATRFFTLCFAGKLNNAEAHAGGRQPCNTDGDIEVELEASGAGTLDITRFRFLGVQVN